MRLKAEESNMSKCMYLRKSDCWITSKLYPNLQFKAQPAYVKPNLNDYFNKTIMENECTNALVFHCLWLIKIDNRVESLTYAG